jgi:hypothetical protein
MRVAACSGSDEEVDIGKIFCPGGILQGFYGVCWVGKFRLSDVVGGLDCGTYFSIAILVD